MLVGFGIAESSRTTYKYPGKACVDTHDVHVINECRLLRGRLPLHRLLDLKDNTFMTMPPEETTALLNDSAITPGFSHQEHLAVATSPAVDEDESEQPHGGHRPRRQRYQQHVTNAFAKSFATLRATFEEQRQSRRLRAVLVSAVVLAATVWGTIVLLRQAVDGIRKLLPPSKAANGTHRPASTTNLTGPYKLVERQVGARLFQYYDFLDGADSLGSAPSKKS
jgi:hypothetical protein